MELGLAAGRLVAAMAGQPEPWTSVDAAEVLVNTPGPWNEWARFRDAWGEELERLPSGTFRLAVAHVLAGVESWALQELPETERAWFHRFVVPDRVARTFLDYKAQLRSTRRDPVPAARAASADRYLRTGHPSHSKHHETAISPGLVGGRLVSYFYIAGADVPPGREGRKFVIAHDSDEFVLYLGRPLERAAQTDERGRLPIYVETDIDPWRKVDEPLGLAPLEWMIYDGRSPHFWWAPPGTVAFYVAASETAGFRDPAAFSKGTRRTVPGSSYGWPEAWTQTGVPEDADIVGFLLGKRLRALRNACGITVRDVERAADLTTNVLGKLEADVGPHTARLNQLQKAANALDADLPRLLARRPLPAARSLASAREAMRQSRATPLLQSEDERRAFAVAPFLVVPPAPGERVTFCQGNADMVLLCLSGAVEVLIAPDPLRLGVSVAARRRTGVGSARPRKASKASHDPSALTPADSSYAFQLSREEVDLFKGQELLVRDRVDRFHAYCFNAALPHAVIGDGRSEVLAVGSRSDQRLPSLWVGRSV